MKPSPCPTCGKEPSTKFWDYESDPSIYCCGATFEAYAAWERYVAAMELAEARAWRKEVWEETQKPWPFVKELRRSGKMAPLWSIFDSFDYAEVCVKKAEKRVDEVFL